VFVALFFLALLVVFGALTGPSNMNAVESLPNMRLKLAAPGVDGRISF